MLISTISLQFRALPAPSLSRYSLPIRELGIYTEDVDFNAGIGAAQMLGKANFIALIGGGRQPKFPQNKVSCAPYKGGRSWR